ncbi:HAMP domain-containing histidine kinase [Candidatus Gracilibacteria bacterium]|nr:HAMP domain-containing histidine kinase [Candidatus Gracilibacteria bacterium]
MILQTILGVSLLSALLIGVIVFCEPKISSREKMFFMSYIVGIIIWTGGIFSRYFFPEGVVYQYGDLPYIIMQILYTGAALVVFSQYWFFSLYKNKDFKLSAGHYISVVLFFIFLVLILKKDAFFSSIELFPGKYAFLERETYIHFFVVYLLFFYFSCIEVLYSRIKKSVNQIYKKQLQILLTSFLFLNTSVMLTNMVLPTYFHLPQFNIIGPAIYLIEAGFFFYAVTKLRFFDLQLTAQKYSTYISSALVCTSPLLITLYFSRSAGEVTTSLVGGVFLLSLALVMLFWEKTKTAFDIFWNLVFYKNRKNPLQRIKEGVKGFQKSIREGLDILAEGMQVHEAQFILAGEVDPVFTNFFKTHPQSELVRDEVEFELGISPRKDLRKIKSALDKYLISVAIPVFDNNKKLLGVILLKQKIEGGLFSVQEIRETRVMLDEATIYLSAEDKQEDIEKRLRDENLVSKEFLNNLLHEIKTPLMMAQNIKEMIAWQQLQPEDQEFISESDESIQELTRKLDSITEAFQWQQGLIPLEKSYLSLSDLFSFLKREFKEESECISLQIKPESLGNKLFLMDTKAIKMAFAEIVKNSIFFRGKNKLQIEIEVEEQNKKLILHFRDNGFGIEQKYWNSIFDLLFVVAESRNPVECGLGVGLTKAKGIIESHQGNIDVVESEKGIGTVFRVEIPLESK